MLRSLLASSCAAALLFLPAALTAQTAIQTAEPGHGIVIANMDTSVRPGDDFYRYANGSYIARTKIPEDRASLNVFSELNEPPPKTSPPSSTTPPIKTHPPAPISARSPTSIAPT